MVVDVEGLGTVESDGSMICKAENGLDDYVQKLCDNYNQLRLEDGGGIWSRKRFRR